jgi:predicted transcriptional regulator
VLSPAAIDSLTADAELRGRLREVVDAETATIGVYAGEIPLAVTIVDGVVHMLVRDGRGVLQAAIDTDNPTVREWAKRRFEHYRVQSEPLTAEEL